MIVTVTISKSFRIIILRRSNFISELVYYNYYYSHLFIFKFYFILFFQSICILLFLLHTFNVFIYLYIVVCLTFFESFFLVYFYLIVNFSNETFIDILLSKSRMLKMINGTKWHLVKFIIFYHLKKKIIMSTQNNLIIIVDSVK